MFKTIYMAKSDSSEINVELERAMSMIHDRMERLLAEENDRRQRLKRQTIHPDFDR